MLLKCFFLLALTLVAGCSDPSDSTVPGADKKSASVSTTNIPDGQKGSTPTGTAPSAKPANLYQVLDMFNVGTTVYVRSMLVEEENRAIWIGTSIGVHEIDLDTKNVRQTFTRKQWLANEYIFAIGRDSEGGKWFGTNAGGASRYHEEQWKTYFPMHGLADYWVYSFANHPDGDLWIGTWAGVNRLNLKTGKMDLYLKELVNEWVYAIEVDPHGRTWFATEGGISLFDDNTWKSWTHEDGLGSPNAHALPLSQNTGLGTRNRHDLGVMARNTPTYNPNYVFSLHIDADGIVWAGTWGGGVSRFDGTTWTSFSTNDGLPGNIIYSLARDIHGTLWAGTNNGLAHFDNGTWVPFTRDMRLHHKNIYTLATTPEGELWAGTKGSVFRIGLSTHQPK